MTRKNPSKGEDIAIVGMAIDVPGAATLAAYWDNLRSGTESIRRLSEDELLAAGETPERMRRRNYVPAAAPLDDFAMFDADFFGFSPKEAAILDPQHRKFLETAWAAMENAGRTPDRQSGPVGVFAGCGMGSYFYFNICSNPDLVDETGMFLLRHTGNDKDFLSTRVSHVFDLRGPSINLQTACSTSLVAVHYACHALRDGDCDMALAGGVTIELPQGRGYLFQENEILSPDGHCHAFDHRAEGTVFGSGAGTVALRRLSDALRDGDHIWGVIKGSAVNNDGAAKAGYLAPSVDGQVAAITAALAAAEVPADSIGYVECHGTGTYLGDPIEVAALTEAWRTQTDATAIARIGSVKSNIGHLDTAAGVAGLIKTTLALYHGQIPPSLSYEAPNPAIDFENSPFTVADRLIEWPASATPRRAAVNALGVGGTNAHVIVEQAPDRPASGEADFPFQIITVSGKSKAALDANALALADHFESHPEQPLADIAFTLKTGRKPFEKRRVLVAETHAEAADLLRSGDSRRVFTHDYPGARPDIVFMFPGGGAQFPDMARDLYETEPVFAEWMDRGLDHLQPQLDYNIRALWLPDPNDAAQAAETLKKPSAQLPLIMIVEYALAQLWLSWGVKPTAMVGHSMGENTAACLAGVLSFEDCIDLVLLRGRLFDTVPAGGMLSVSLPLADLEPLLDTDIDIASVNAPALTAVSGSNAALDRLAAKLTKQDIDHQRIPIDIAAHSRMLDPILDDYRAFLSCISLSPPMIPVISNRTGAPLTPEQATDPDYWVAHLRNSVMFADCIAHLATTPRRVYLEVGPGKALSSLAQMCDAVQPGQVLSSLRHPDQVMPDDAYFLQTIGRLWACGLDADWDQYWGEARRNRVILPGYQFQRARYFIEPGTPQIIEGAALPTRAEDMADWGWRMQWRPELAALDTDIEVAIATPLKWLVFSDQCGVSDPVIARLRDAGHRVVTVTSGDTFMALGEHAYSLPAEQGRSGYDALFTDLAERDLLPDRIAHFWLVTTRETFRPGSNFFTRNQEHGFYSLLHIAQALADHDPEGVHLSAITTGAQRIADEPLSYPEKSTIAGPIGVIPREVPGLTCSSLDIALPADRNNLFHKQKRDTETLTGPLLEELLATPMNGTFALRGTRRLSRKVRPLPLPPISDSPFTDGGTYMITGGFGGIGLTIAADLIARHSANIILLSRTALPPRDTWDRHLESHGPTDKSARAIRAIQALEEKGGAVLVAQADVADIAQMRQASDTARARFGTITGVIHAAGTINDGPLLAKSALDCEAVFAPKINGLRVLDQVFPDGALSLLVLFSSTSTVIAAAGQVDYVAANAYLNAVAAARQGGKTRVIALNWGVWADTGMAARATQHDDTPPPVTAITHPLLSEATFDTDGARLLKSRLAAKDTWVLDQHRTRAGDALLPGTGYIELAAEALAVQGHAGPFEIRDLTFLRPLDVGDSPREISVRLAEDEDGWSFETRSDVTLEGRAGHVVNATAGLAPLSDSAPSIKRAAIAARCPNTRDGDGQRLHAPQEEQLNFGAHWHVLQRISLGDGEGLADLALPRSCRSVLNQGIRLHPGLMDIATGWAMELIDGYSPDHLWVPLSYGTIRVFASLPATCHSWVRRGPETMDGFASFDVTIFDDAGQILVEVEDFAIKRLATATGFARAPQIAARDVIFADAERPLSPEEEQLAETVAMGICADEGAEALRRALMRANTDHLSQITVSSLDLPALIARAGRAPRNAATGQTFERPDLDSAYIAPEGGIEETLTGLWRTLLGVTQVGALDSFFDLGGHSLIAVRLFSQINKTYGVQFPISALFEAPTIRALAAMIEARVGPVDSVADAPDKPTHRHLVALHQGDAGPRAPLFLVAGMFGNVMNLRHLGLMLGRDRPVYGLQARGLTGGEAPHATINEAAADYIAEMRSVQPDGPYLLGGFSGGGITAYEMAQQVRAAGQDVGALILLDTPLPMRPPLNRRDKALIKRHEIADKGLAYLGEWVKNRIAWEIAKRQPAPQATADGAYDNAGIEAAFRGALARYDLHDWDGPLTLFRPPLDRHWSVSNGNWVSAAREYVFDDNDWTRFAPAIEVIEVPGDHDSMVLVPSVGVLVARIRSLLRDAERHNRSAPRVTATAAE